VILALALLRWERRRGVSDVSIKKLRSDRAWLVLAALLITSAWFLAVRTAYGVKLWAAMVPLVLAGAATMVYISAWLGARSDKPRRPIPVVYWALFLLIPVGSLALILGSLFLTAWLAQAGLITALVGVGLSQLMFFREKGRSDRVRALLVVGSILAFVLGGWVGPVWLMWAGIWTFGGLFVLSVVSLLIPKKSDREGAG
jgi:MFS family permease